MGSFPFRGGFPFEGFRHGGVFRSWVGRSGGMGVREDFPFGWEGWFRSEWGSVRGGGFRSAVGSF